MKNVIRELYRRGFRDFLCGGATGFDALAAAAVLELRDGCPGMALTLVLPCADQTRGWSEAEKALHEQQKTQADRTIVLSPHYYTGCMMVRNRYMVDHAGFCVACMQEPKGGTAHTVRLAVRAGIPVLNLAVTDEADDFVRASAADEELPF